MSIILLQWSLHHSMVKLGIISLAVIATVICSAGILWIGRNDNDKTYSKTWPLQSSGLAFLWKGIQVNPNTLVASPQLTVEWKCLNQKSIHQMPSVCGASTLQGNCTSFDLRELCAVNVSTNMFNRVVGWVRNRSHAPPYKGSVLVHTCAWVWKRAQASRGTCCNSAALLLFPNAQPNTSVWVAC